MPSLPVVIDGTNLPIQLHGESSKEVHVGPHTPGVFGGGDQTPAIETSKKTILVVILAVPGLPEKVMPRKSSW